MILPLVKEPHPLLHQKAIPIEAITPEIQRLIEDMIDTMHAAEGVGLAANQVGSGLHLFVASPDGQRGKELVFLNAALSQRRGKQSSAEGCLSVPGVSAPVERDAQITAIGKDRMGKTQTLRASGLLARILQHEVDHLEGHLYLDRLKAAQRESLLSQYKKLSDTLGRIAL